jgi:hypothetical protein
MEVLDEVWAFAQGKLQGSAMLGTGLGDRLRRAQAMYALEGNKKGHLLAFC